MKRLALEMSVGKAQVLFPIIGRNCVCPIPEMIADSALNWDVGLRNLWTWQAGLSQKFVDRRSSERSEKFSFGIRPLIASGTRDVERTGSYER